MTVTILHNPRCSKSRQTLALIEDKGVTPEVIEYLKAPPTAEAMDGILTRLSLEPRQAMRKQEAPYKDLALDNPALSRGELIAAMVAHPILIERPIVIAGGKARIGRPPEAVLEIL